MMTIAVSNARGFLGKAICEGALSRGHRVIGIVFNELESPENLPGVIYIRFPQQGHPDFYTLTTETNLSTSHHSQNYDQSTERARNPLFDAEVLIHAGGPYTIDLSLLESQSYVDTADGLTRSHTQSSIKSDIPKKASDQSSTHILNHYSQSTGTILNIALRMPRLKHFIGLSSLTVAQIVSNARVKRNSPSKFPHKFLLEGPIGSKYYPGLILPELGAIANPMATAAVAFERSVAGSTGWQIPSIQRTILRIGTLVGHSETGYYPNLKGLYSVVPFVNQLTKIRSLFNAGPFIPLPFYERSRLSVLPVDIAAEAIITIATKDNHQAKDANQKQNEFLDSKHPLVSYLHLSDSERDISVRRFFAANLRHYGIDTPPLAVGHSRYFVNFCDKIGLDAKSIDLNSFDIPWNTQEFRKVYPEFKLKAVVDYYPALIRYAQQHLLHKNSFYGAQESKGTGD